MDSLFECLFNRICYNDGNVLYLFSLSTIITHCIIHLKKWIFSFISLNLKFKLLHVAGGYHIGPHNEFCFIDPFSWISHQIHNYHMVEEASKIILRCINNSLTEVSRVVILMVPVHYSERIQIMTSNRKRHIGQSPGQNRYKTICCHLPQKWCKQPVFLPEMMFDTSCRVLPTRRDHTSPGANRSTRDCTGRHGWPTP